MATLKLEPHELDSPLVEKFRAYFRAELDDQRVKNDELTLTPEMTAANRGRIRLLKEQLKMIEKPAPAPSPGKP